MQPCLLLLCLAALGLLSPAAAAPRARRWVEGGREWVAAPGQDPLQLHDVLLQNSNLKFSDYAKELTAIKDVSDDIRACFITDLDPEWTLSYADKMELMDSLERQDIRSPDDLLRLQQQAGPDIASMCSKMHLYWLTRAAPPRPVPQLPSVGSNGVQAPPSLMRTPPPLGQAPPSFNQAPPSFNQAPPSFNQAPPSFNQAPPSLMRTPPPLVDAPPPQFKVPLQQGVLRGEGGKEPEFQAPMRTPPPLFPTPPPLQQRPGEVAARLAPKEVVAAPSALRTPPPLGVYLASRQRLETPPPLMRVPPPPQLYRSLQQSRGQAFPAPPPL